MALIAGTSNTDYSGSMAEAIENAFKQEWLKVMNTDKEPESNEQMKLLFVAIAQGVVKHLVDNQEAFKVDIKILGVTVHAEVKIEAAGPLY